MSNLPPNLANQLQQRLQLQQLSKNVPNSLKRQIGQAAINSQIVRKQKSYYSLVRFPFTVSGSGPYTYTLAANTVSKAFTYGTSETATIAGFDSSFTATDAETNMTARFDTGGATVMIYGIALHPTEVSDAHLVKLLWANSFVDITLDGVQRYSLLGRPGRIPGGGGLFGAGASYVIPPSTRDQIQFNVGSLSNGVPHIDNYLALTEPLNWMPMGMGDSKFQVRFTVARTLTHTATARAADATVAMAAWAPPTSTGAVGTYVDVMTYLKTIELLPRSQNA